MLQNECLLFLRRAVTAAESTGVGFLNESVRKQNVSEVLLGSIIGASCRHLCTAGIRNSFYS